MDPSDLHQRLRDLIAAVGATAVSRVPLTENPASSPEGADEQRIATSHIDELLRRVAALTGVLGSNGQPAWDDVDRLAAQILLADLAVVTATTRALNDLAAKRLATAHADLVAAGRDADAALRDQA